MWLKINKEYVTQMKSQSSVVKNVLSWLDILESLALAVESSSMFLCCMFLLFLLPPVSIVPESAVVDVCPHSLSLSANIDILYI